MEPYLFLALKGIKNVLIDDKFTNNSLQEYLLLRICRKVVISLSTLQKQVIQSLNGLSEDNLQFLLDMIQRFMKPSGIGENNNEKSDIIRNGMRRIGSLEGQDLIDADYDIDA